MNRGERVEAVLAELPGSPRRAAALARTLDLEQVWAEAQLFGLRPLLSHHLPALFPLPAMERVTATFQTTRLLRSTLLVLGRLDEAGIQALVLKGVPLAARLYPAAWLRPSSDVDVLVHPRDLSAAAAALERAGFRQVTLANDHAVQFGHDLGFTAPGRPLVELHFAPSWHFQARFDVDALMARATTVELEGQRVRVLGPADDLVQLSVHAAAHTYEGVKWLFDLKLAAERLGPAHWQDVIVAARRAKVAVVTGMSLDEARRRVHAPIPPWVLEALLPGRSRQRIVSLWKKIPPRFARTRSYGFDLLLPDGLSVDWTLRLIAPPLNRLAGAVGVHGWSRSITARWESSPR